MLREAIEQYIALAAGPWREVHDRGEPPAPLPWTCRRRCRLRRGHHGAGPGLPGGQGPADPAPREQVLRPCRLLASCDQPRPCDALAAAGQRAEIAAPGAALHLLARRVAAAPRSRDRGEQPARCGSTRRSDIPDFASPVVRGRVALQRSDGTHTGGRRSGGSRSDHTRHEVLQEPSGSDRAAACNGAGELHTCYAAPQSGLRKGGDFVLPGEPGRHATRQQHCSGTHSTGCGASPGSIARRAGDRSRACTTFGTASRFTA